MTTNGWDYKPSIRKNQNNKREREKYFIAEREEFLPKEVKVWMKNLNHWLEGQRTFMRPKVTAKIAAETLYEYEIILSKEGEMDQPFTMPKLHISTFHISQVGEMILAKYKKSQYQNDIHHLTYGTRVAIPKELFNFDPIIKKKKPKQRKEPICLASEGLWAPRETSKL